MRVTWWGHSCATVTAGQQSVLTDPVLGDRVAHLRRRMGPTPPAGAAVADVVVVSHLHADHFDVSSLRRIDPGARLLVPRGGRGVLRHRAPWLARRCEEMVPGDAAALGPMTLTATPAAHPGVRGPWSRHRGAAMGFLITAAGATLWFAGDTGLGEFMSDLGQLDAALIPVGGWGPTLGPEHLDPARACEATRRCAPRLSIPMHYGTFWPVGLNRVRPELFAPPGDDYARLVHTAALATRVCVLAHGEGVEVPERVAGGVP